MSYRGLAGVVLIALGCCVKAEAQTAAPDETSKLLAAAARDKERKEGFFGALALAYLASRGNAVNSSLNAQLNLGYLTGRWRHAGMLKAVRGASDGITSAEEYRATAQSDYAFSQNNYAFFGVDYDRDQFGAYLRRTSATTGLGRRFIDTPAHSLDLQAGVGSRWTRRPGEEAAQEGIVVGLGKYEWKITDHSAFSERLSVEAGHDNTYSESVTALTADIQGNLALSLSYTVKHNTSVPPDRVKTDSATAVSVLYGF